MSHPLLQPVSPNPTSGAPAAPMLMDGHPSPPSNPAMCMAAPLAPSHPTAVAVEARSYVVTSPHDGWHSRKLKLALVALVAPFGVATVALFMGRMTGPEWISLVQWLVPGVLVPYVLGNVGEKLAGALHKRSE